MSDTTPAPQQDPPAPQQDDPPAPREPMIPKSRLDAQSAKLKAAEEQLSGLQKELEKLKPAAAQLDALTKERDTLSGRLSFAVVGVTDAEHIEAVQAAYGKLAEQGRPESAATYWGEIVAGRLQVPRTLAGFMPAAAPASDGAGGAAAPRLPAAGASPPPASPAVTPAQVKEAQDAFRASPTPENRKRMVDLTAALAKKS